MKERVYGRELKLGLKLMLIASGARRSCEEGAPLFTSFLPPLSFFILPCTAAIKTTPLELGATQNARKAHYRTRCQLCGVGLSEVRDLNTRLCKY